MFFLRMSAITALSMRLRRYLSDPTGAWLAAWLIIHSITVAVMLILSFWTALTTWSAWGITAGMVMICFYASRHQLRSVFQTPPVGFVLFLPVVLLMGARATAFPEFTHDSHTY